jgi:hypothetical protein
MGWRGGRSGMSVAVSPEIWSVCALTRTVRATRPRRRRAVPPAAP